MRGRSTALRVANEMATGDGAPWSIGDVARFHGVQSPKDATLHSDDLRDLLDLAVLATSRRVNEALTASAQARAESERLSEQAMNELEQRFTIKRLSPSAQLLATAVSGDQSFPTDREMMALCAPPSAS